MDGIFEYYTLRLKALSPVFIGSGRSVNKKEFCFIPEKNLIRFMNMESMINFIIENKPEHITDFEKFMLDDESLKKSHAKIFKSGLTAFLDIIGMDEATREKCIIYEIANDGVFGSENTLCEIFSFMRGSDGRAYVPGSAVKGMIHTMLFQQLIRKNRKEPGSENTYIDNVDKEDRAALINTLALKYKEGSPDRNNATNSIMRGISISDSDPFDNECLTICRKLDLRTDGEINAINVVRECLRPGTELCFRIKIDKRYFKPLNMSGSFEDIFKSITADFDNEYHQFYLSKFPQDKHTMAIFNDDFVILGGGSGYFSKNIIYTHFGFNEGLRKVSYYMKNRTKNNPNDIKHGISPHTLKITEYNGTRYHSGVCSARLEKERVVL